MMLEFDDLWPPAGFGPLQAAPRYVMAALTVAKTAPGTRFGSPRPPGAGFVPLGRGCEQAVLEHEIGNFKPKLLLGLDFGFLGLWGLDLCLLGGAPNKPF